MTLIVFPCSIVYRLYFPKGRVSPIMWKGLTLLLRLIETPASPSWASATVTGTLATLSSADSMIRRTIPDSEYLPPGLYCSAY